MINANEYFEGNVKSLGYKSAEGNSTIGVMEEGEYEFKTSAAEIMVVVQGQLDVQQAGEKDWKSYTSGQHFNVPANSSFLARSKGQTAYLCKYQ